MTGGTCDNLRSGNPGQVAIIRSAHKLLSRGHPIDSVRLDFRYVAGCARAVVVLVPRRRRRVLTSSSAATSSPPSPPPPPPHSPLRYTPQAGEHKNASILSVVLVDGANDVLKTLYTSPPLAAYSYDTFKGYSPPIHVRAASLNFSAAEAYVALRFENHERNVQIPLDGAVGGLNVTVGWAA